MAARDTLGEDRSRGTVKADLSDAFLDDGSDWFNLACTRIVIVMLGGLLAIYLETFL